MRVRGERECRRCGTVWAYYDTGSVACPSCGSLQSVGVDDRTRHTAGPAPFDLSSLRERVDPEAPAALADEVKSTAREYLRHPNARTIGLLGWRLDTRRQLGSVDLGEGRTLYVYEAGTGGRGELTESELETLEAARRRDERSVVELTFGRNPFGTTQTITAFVLFGIGWLV